MSKSVLWAAVASTLVATASATAADTAPNATGAGADVAEALPPRLEAKVQRLPPAEQARARRFIALDRSLHRRTGDVRIPSADLTLHLGERFYYLPPEDARRVIVEGWGNPPETATDTLGLIFPQGSSWTDEHGWGANITFDAVGYVAQVDHSQADYDKVDREMRDAEPESNAARGRAGAPAIHYVGWAQAPTYDSATHTAVWARDLKFDGADVDTLNYDLRTLGRRGVLSMNIISGMPEIGAVRAAAVQLQSIASFDPGSRYADYKAGDKKTAYGIAGLIAAGAGLVVAKKVGLVGLILLFGKKAAVLLAAGAAAAVNWFRRLTGRTPKARSATTAPPPPGPDAGAGAEPHPASVAPAPEAAPLPPLDVGQPRRPEGF